MRCRVDRQHVRRNSENPANIVNTRAFAPDELVADRLSSPSMLQIDCDRRLLAVRIAVKADLVLASNASITSSAPPLLRNARLLPTTLKVALMPSRVSNSANRQVGIVVLRQDVIFGIEPEGHVDGRYCSRGRLGNSGRSSGRVGSRLDHQSDRICARIIVAPHPA